MRAAKALSLGTIGRVSNATIESVEPRRLFSTTYYVSPTGNDNNAGTSINAPWKTAAKVDGTSLQPGDSILFQSGAQFHEVLSPISSGTSSAPITFGRYGDPNLPNPEFFGSDPINSSAFTLVSGTTYSVRQASAANWVYDNHAFTHESQDALTAAGTPSSDPATNISYVSGHTESFYYDSSTTTLYVNVGGSLANHVISDVTRLIEISSNDQSYLTFKNLDVTECAADANTFAFDAVGPSSNIQFISCNATLTGKHAFGAIDSTHFLGENLLADQTAPDLGFGGASAYVAFSDQLDTGDTSQWINDTYTHPNGPYQAFITHGDTNSIGSVLLKNLVADDSGAPSLFCESTGPNERITVLGGQLGGSIEFDTNNSVIDGLRLDQPEGTIILAGTNDVVQNCLFTNLSPNVFAGHNGGLEITGTNDIARFNTFSFTGGPAIVIKNPSSNADVYGNIFDCTTAIWLLFNEAGVQQSHDNLFSPSAYFVTHDVLTTQYLSIPQWQALGYDTTSLFTDPEFANKAGGNYQLTGTSSAIDLYTATPDTSVTGISVDFAGNRRPFGAGYDAGAFEYQAAKTPITGSLSVANISVPAPLPGTSTTAIFTVTISSPQAGTATVQYATADGTAVAGTDYTAANGTLTFAPGVTSQTVAVQVSANQSKTFNLILSSPSAGLSVTSATAIATITTANETSRPFNRKTPLPYIDSAGHPVVLKVGGAGSGTALFITGDADPVQIVLTGTTAASSFTILSPRGATTLADVSVQAPLGSFSGLATKVSGSLTFSSTVRAITLGNAISSARIIMQATTGLTSIRLGAVDGLNLTAASGIASLSAASWTASNSCTITTPAIASLSIRGALSANLAINGVLGSLRSGSITGGTWDIAGPTGNVTATSTASGWTATFGGGARSINVLGDLSGEITASAIHFIQIHGNTSQARISLTGTGPAPDLSLLNVAGSADNLILRSAGNVGAITVGAAVDSIFFAGVSPTLTTLPTTTTDFVSNAQIASFTEVEPKSQAAGFSNTLVAASTISRARVKGVMNANGGIPFGFATTSLSSFADTEANVRPFRWTAKESTSLLTFPGDFKVTVI